MTKSYNFALAVSFACLLLVSSQDAAERPSRKKSIDTAAHGESAEERFQSSMSAEDSTRAELVAGSRQPAATTGSEQSMSTTNMSWHAHLHVDHIFNTTANLEKVAFGESEYFIQKLFRKYGMPNMLQLPALEKLMKNLGLKLDNETTKTTESQLDQEMNAEKNPTASKRRRSITHIHSDHSECHPPKDLLSAFHFERLAGLDVDHFLLLCPAVIEQLDNIDCHRQHSNQHYHEHQHYHERSDDQATHEHNDDVDNAVAAADLTSEKKATIGDISPLVWVYSFVAVLVISLVGLLGVAVIPIMRQLLYKNLLQFLIALAVGALSGDALLHLLPHALTSGESGQDHSPGAADPNRHPRNSTATREEGHSHDRGPVWKGLVALLGLLFFFLTERILTIVTTRRAKRRLEKKARGRVVFDLKAEVKDEVVVVLNPDNIPFRETAIVSDDDDDDNETFLNNNRRPSRDHGEPTTQAHGESESQGHGHGHSHHNGVVPDSVSAVAWMVIFGDGIHNLSDGLAIGAAFASSVTVGFSTAVAVFCHELPHEIGDFAMLLNAGMTAKQALLYNVLSSFLCLLGMVVGVLLGQVHSASAWIFCAVAGMFLYISLADMLPQLTVSERRGALSPCRQLLLQCLGVSIGATIMLTIAIFEDDLKTLLD